MPTPSPTAYAFSGGDSGASEDVIADPESRNADLEQGIARLEATVEKLEAEAALDTMAGDSGMDMTMVNGEPVQELPGSTSTATVTSEPTSVNSTPPASVLDIPYGDDPNQVGDLRLPGGSGLTPVVVLIHGGFWQEPFKRDLMESLALDLTRRGFATWNLEYRRVGASGGGWPQTATDVARGIDHLAALASTYSLDLSRVALVGHSAGGHLALWAGARQRLPEAAPGARPEVMPTYLVSLAGVADLEEADRRGLGWGAVARFLGPSRDRSAIYPEASPRALVPLGVPQLLVHGTADRIVPITQSERYAAAARIAGDEVEFLSMPEATHFSLIRLSSPAWNATAARLIDRLAPHPG